MSEIIEQLKSFTYGYCYDCSSRHYMEYDSHFNEYMCEECYRTVSFDKAMDEEHIEIDWVSLKQYIAGHKTPKKAIKMFIVKILRDEWERYDIDETYNALITTNSLFLY